MEIVLLALLAALSSSSSSSSARSSKKPVGLGNRPWTPLGPVQARAKTGGASTPRKPNVVPETPAGVKPPASVDKTGQLVAGVLGDCAKGATIGLGVGSAILPGAGTAIGAAVGCLAFNVPRIIVAAQGGDPAEV